MTEPRSTARIAILAHGVCIPDAEHAATLGFSDVGIDASVLPPMMRRRTSQATRVAISAASRASSSSNDDTPAIFVSSTGEMQVTDKLCRAIAADELPLSPTLFHNSVHNTAAGYWSISTGNQAAMQAMGALADGFALALLEAWCQLQSDSERVLLVAYDEAQPALLLPDYRWQTCAFALMLGREQAGKPLLQCPSQCAPSEAQPAATGYAEQNPAMAALPLFQQLTAEMTGTVTLASGPQCWQTELSLP